MRKSLIASTLALAAMFESVPLHQTSVSRSSGRRISILSAAQLKVKRKNRKKNKVARKSRRNNRIFS